MIIDVLDMVGISYFFELIEVVVNIFVVGVDIVFMLIEIRSLKDLEVFEVFIDWLE